MPTDLFKIINKFTLVFDDVELEKEFTQYSINKVKETLKYSVFIAAFSSAIVGLIGYYGSFKTSFTLDVILQISAGLIFWFLSAQQFFQKYYNIYVYTILISINIVMLYGHADDTSLFPLLNVYAIFLFISLVPYISFYNILFSIILILTSVMLMPVFFNSITFNIAIEKTLLLLSYFMIVSLVLYIKQMYERLSFYKSKELKKVNIRLLNENKTLEMQSVLAKILKASTHPNINIKEFLDEALNLILNISWLKILPKGSIFLTNKNGELEMIAHKNIGVLTKTCAIVKSGQCLCGLALQKKQMLFNNCVTHEHTTRPEGMTPHGHFNIPIMLDDNVLGVINIYVTHGHQKTTDEEKFFGFVANTLASVIYRNQLEKEKEQYLNNLKRYFVAIEQSEATIMFTDLEGKIKYANPFFYNLTGFKVDEVVGKSVKIQSSGKTPRETYNDMWNTLMQKKTWKGEFINRKKNGEEYVEKAIISPITNENNEVVEYIAIKEDVTQAKQNVKTIIEQKHLLEQKHLKIKSSINYAQRIQQSLLASSNNLYDIFDEVIINFLPKETVSGDFYLVREKNNHIYITVSDCTGHGVPGALVSVLGIQEIDHIIDTCNCPVNGMLNILNRKIDVLLNNDNEIGSDGMDLVMLKINKQLKQINFSGAKGLFYIFSNGELVRYKTDAFSIGQQSKTDINFTEQTISYQTGDTVFLLTDGLQDQISKVNQKRIGSKRVKQLMTEVATSTLNNKQNLINSFIKTHLGDFQIDDITFITFKL